MPHYRDHYAIVVGIEGDGASAATGARDDAIAIAEWLRSDNGGGVPAANLHLIVSGPTPSSADRGLPPQRFEFDRALRNIGVLSAARMGRRLYLYFAGHAFAGPGGDIALLMAEIDPSDPGNAALDLHSCITTLAHAAAFDELVVWIDAHRIEISLWPTPLPFQPISTRASDTTLFSLVAVSPQRGTLTRRLLEALQISAADQQGHPTAESVSQFVRDHVRQVTVEMTAPHEIAFGTGIPGTAILAVEVPHWTAAIAIRDDRSRPIPWVGEIAEEAPGRYVSKTGVPPGIYQVAVSLDGITEDQLVFVSPTGGKIITDSWQRLKISSAAPVTGTASDTPEHGRLAAEWSKITTWVWDRPRATESRLFIFARTLVTESILTFFAGLTLLDAHGKPLTDFRDSIVPDPVSGCIAFNAALPAGFYVLRRRRSGVRTRSQPLYLCPGWETHIFLTGRRNPGLGRWTYNMVPQGSGHRPDDDSNLAAAAVTEALYRDSDVTALIDSGRMRTLYEGSDANPWLGILAAYALLQHRDWPGRAASAETERDRENRLAAVTIFLKTTIPTHPDVRVLLLDDPEVGSSFQHPPLLRSGIARIKAYATSRQGIIPLDSLTDCVADSLVTNSAWTAWRYLSRQPVNWAADETARRVTDDSLQQPAGLPTRGFAATAYAAALPPSTPVFSVGAPSRGRRSAAASPIPAQTIGGPWAEAAVLQVAGAIANTGFTELPEKLVIEPDQQITQLLSMLDPKRVATGLGITYERAAQALEQLRDASQTGQTGAGAAARPAVIEQAVQAITDNLLGSGDGSRPSSSELTIEECVTKLREQADDWTARANGFGGERRLANFAKRLRDVSDELLARANYMALTEAGGRLLYANGAFQFLVGSARTARERDAALRAWRAALEAAPPGQSSLLLSSGGPATAPANTVQPEWQLKRIPIESGDALQTRGYFNVFRKKEVPPLAPDTLSRMAKTFSELTVYSALYALSPASNAAYLDSIQTDIARLERIVGE